MKTKTLEEIYNEIKEQGFITEKQISLIKRRCTAAGRDLFDNTLIEGLNDGYGIPITEEQGRKGLAWLYKFLEKDIYGYREKTIIEEAKADDFTFMGFYSPRPGAFIPFYNLCGMEYVPLKEPYIVG